MKKYVLSLFLLFIYVYLFSSSNKNVNEYHFDLEEDNIVYAISDGYLMSYGYDIDKGNYVEIKYFNIGITVMYCHLKSFYYFNNNQIRKGDKIGKTGYTGNVMEPELMLIVSIDDFFISNSLENLEDALPHQ